MYHHYHITKSNFVYLSLLASFTVSSCVFSLLNSILLLSFGEPLLTLLVGRVNVR